MRAEAPARRAAENTFRGEIAHAQLQAGLQAVFTVLVVLAALMLAIAVAILVVARRAEKEMGPADVAGPVA